VISDQLHREVLAWMADDPDEQDRAELLALLRTATGRDADNAVRAAAELEDRFAARLEFGTAGLRGAVGAGPNRMNRAVVRGTTAALASWLLYVDPAAADSGVVIGSDARHRSDEFALEAARVLAGAGIAVHLLPPRQPTPLLAFAVRHLATAAGVMITASHNPPADNGYKLYLGDGAQIVPPADLEIEAAIRTLGPLSQIPVAPADDPLIVRHGDEIAAAYLDAICAVSPAPRGSAWLRFTYTPLHGVAGGLALRAFEQAGFPAPDVVETQFDPDPEFRTVAIPNPEEPGALDLALAKARRSGAELVIANDPDGDRMAVAVPDDEAPGGWRTLTGDQVGALLGAYLLERDAAATAAAAFAASVASPAAAVGGSGSDQHGPVAAVGAGSAEPDATGRQEPLVASTIVSATLLASIAAAAGAQYAETLTGFKWIVRAADLRPEVRFIYGYEEALGYTVGRTVRDKDGIGAALALLSLAAKARSGGESLVEAYDALEIAHGVHLTEQITIPTTEPVRVMSRLRIEAPAELAGQPITATSDLTGGTDQLPSADVLRYWLRGARVVIRPSGTEPKIKAYLEVVEPVIAGRLTEARRAARARMDPLAQAVRDLLND
jgi:phosphomannomutase